MTHIHGDQPSGDSAPLPPVEKKEIGVLKGMAFAVLYENDPGFELGLAITAVGLIGIGALLNLMGAHPGVLSHVGTIGLRVVESAAFATGIFFASTLILRHFLKAIGEGGWIAEIRSDQIVTKRPLVASLFSADDALLSAYDPTIGQSPPEFFPRKFTFKILDQDATLYVVYSHTRIEHQLQEALKKATSLDDIPVILSQILQETDCNVALKMGSQVFVSAQNYLHIYTDENSETHCVTRSLSRRKETIYDMQGTEVLILGAPSTMSFANILTLETDVAEGKALKECASNLKTEMQEENKKRFEQKKELQPSTSQQVEETFDFGEVTFVFINLGTPIESSS